MAAITVQLIEEHEVTRVRLQVALETEPGMTVVDETGDVAAAMLKLPSMQPDVVVISLAESKSLDAIRRIRQQYPQIYVLALAPQAESGAIMAALQVGAQGVVLRHSQTAEIVKAVRAVQAGGTFIGGAASTVLLQDYVSRRSGMAVAGPIQRLSKRERQVLDLVVQGMTTNEIAQELAISPKSVETYRGRLMAKIGVRNLPDLVKYAMQNGLLIHEQPA